MTSSVAHSFKEGLEESRDAAHAHEEMEHAYGASLFGWICWSWVTDRHDAPDLKS